MTQWRWWVASVALAGGVACSGGAAPGQGGVAENGGRAQSPSISASTSSGSTAHAPSVTRWSWQDGYDDNQVEVSNLVAVAPSGTIYRVRSVSQRSESTNGAWFLDMFEPGGRFVWSTEIGPILTRDVTGLTTDPSGAPIVIGQYSGATTDGFASRYSLDGSYVTTVQMPHRANAVVTDASGDVIVAQAGGTLTKYGPTDWKILWTRTLPNANLTQLAIDASGNLLAGGWVSQRESLDGYVVGNDGSYTDIFARFTANGSTLWAKDAPGRALGVGSSASGTLVALVEVSASNATWGSSTLASGQRYLVTAESNGSPRWSRAVDGGWRLAVDPAGQVTVATVTPGDCYSVGLQQRDLAGDFLWARSFAAESCDTSNSMPIGFESLGDVAVGPDHSIVLGGSFTGSVDFGDATRTTQLSGTNPDDAFLVSIANGETPTAYDAFQRTGTLGSKWTVAAGSWSTDGNFASGTGAGALAVSNAAPVLDSAASIIVNVPLHQNTQAGIVLRANPNAPTLDHYAAVLNESGLVTLQRTVNGETLDLIDGAAPSAGAHRLTFAAVGTDPVVLSVAVDGKEVIHTEDSSAERITWAGLGGMYDSRGFGEPLDGFWFMPLDGAQGTQPPSRQQGPLVAVAAFDGSTGQGTAPDEEDFDGTGSYSTDPNVWITKCHWDFGDGAVQDDCWVAHTYQMAGTYHPTLTITGSDGSSASASLTVTVTDASTSGTGGSGTTGGTSGGGTSGSGGSTTGGSTSPVVAVIHFDGSTGQGTAPDEEDLDGTSSYSTDSNVWITACHWVFGDGSTANDCWVAHTYTQAGTYHPSLTVTGSDGSTSSASVDVVVSN